MELVIKKLAEIIPYENNPRKNDQAVDAVMESIKQCEYVAPIVVDEDGVILAGHTRLKAMKKLGWTECEVVVKAGLTEEQKQKYRLLDNKTGEIADWDYEKLAEELDGLDFGDLDLDWDFIKESSSAAESAVITPTGGKNKEINLEDYEDDKFECECPRCGFRFNP